MSGLEPFAAKLVGTVAGRVAAPVAQKAKARVFGQPHVNALVRLAEKTLDSVLSSASKLYALGPGQEGAVRYSLNGALNSLETVELYPTEADHSLAELRSAALASGVLEDLIIDIAQDGSTVRIDCAVLLGTFIVKLRENLDAEAQKHGSVLNEFVAQRRLAAILEAHRTMLTTCSFGSNRSMGIDAVLERTEENFRRELNVRLNADPDAGEFEESGATQMWNQFRSSVSWRSQVDDAMRRLLDYLPLMEQRPDLTWAFEADGVTATYRTARRWLRKVDWAGVIAQLDHIKFDLQQSTALDGTPKGPKIAENARAGHAARWLRNQANEPLYRYCLAILGSWGSGKSRLLNEFARKAQLAGALVLFPQLRPNVDVSSNVLQCANLLLGTNLLDFAGLDEFLDSNLGKDLFILLDDAEQHMAVRLTAAAELTDLLEKCTEFTRIRWVVTANGNGYADLVDRTDQFWTDYGFSTGHPSSRAGWLDLDELNLASHIGLRLIRKGPHTGYTSVLRQDPITFANELRVLTNPRVAKIWQAQFAPIESAAYSTFDLNYRDFVIEFWKEKQESIARRGFGPDVQDAGITTLGLIFAEGNVVQPFETLAGRLAAQAVDAPFRGDLDRCRAFLYELEHAGLLLVWRPAGDPTERVLALEATIHFPTFWGLRIANPVVAQSVRGADPREEFARALAPWLGEASDDAPLGLAVCQFALALLRWDDAAGDIARKIWTDWVRSMRPVSPAMLAAITGPRDARDTLVGLMKYVRDESSSKRGLFTTLRFLQLHDLPTWEAQKRLRLLQPRYGDVERLGLSRYAASVVVEVVRDPALTSARNYVSTLNALIGIEDAGAAAEAAAAAAQQGQDMFGDSSEWLRRVVDFITKASTSSATHSNGIPTDSVVGDGRGIASITSRRPFYEHLVREVVRLRIEDVGLAAFQELHHVGWFNGVALGMGHRTALRMRQEANTAFGLWLRDHDEQADAIQSYLSLVDDLLHKRFEQIRPNDREEMAFHLIFHTRVTQGAEAVEVDAVFHSALVELGQRPTVRERIHRLPAMLALNGLSV